MAGLYFQVGADFQKLQKLKKDLDDLKIQLKSMDSAADKKAFDALNRQLQQTQKEYDVLSGKLSKYVAEQDRAARSTDNASDSLLNYIKKGAALAGVTFGLDKIKNLGSEVINVRNEFQQLEIAFGTMLKSTDKASVLMKDLAKFAAETPFGLQSAATGAKQLLAYGSTADTVIKELTMLGDVAAGTGQQIGDLVYLYGTLRTQGRAYLMDIRQFAGRGIPIYDELAKVLKINKDQVNDFVSAGKVGFKEVELAFKNMTAQGGLYGGLMEQQSKSIGGRIEALKDNIDAIFNEIGKNSEGVIYKSIDGLNSLVENYDKVGKILVGLVATYGIATAAEKLHIAMMMVQATSTNTVTGAKAAQIVVTNALTAAQTKLNASMLANPYVLVAAAVVALGYGIYELTTYTTAAEEATKRISETTKQYESTIESESVRLNILFGRLKSAKEGTDKYKDAKQGILDIADKYHLSISKDIDLVKEETKYRKILNEAIIETAKAKAIESGTQKATDIYTQQWGEGISDIRDRFISKFGEDQGELLLDSLKESLSGGTELTKEVKHAISKFSEIYYGSSATGGGSTSLNPVQQVVNNIQLSKKVLDKEIEDLEVVFGKLRKTTESSDIKTAKSGADQISEATKKVQDLKKELNDLNKKIIPDIEKNNPSFDFYKAIEEKTKEYKEAENKLSVLVSGKSSSELGKQVKTDESSSEKARKQAQAIKDQQDKINELLNKQSLERKRQDEDLENQITQARINAMHSGSDKIREQREYDNKIELQAIERQKEDYVRSIIQSEKEKFEAQEELSLKKNPKYTKKVFNPSSVKVDTSKYDNILGFKITSDINAEIAAANKAWNDYFLQFGNYQEKRKAIVEKYNREISEAQTEGEKAILQKGMQDQLDELDNSVRNSATLMGQLFADSSRKSVDEIGKIISKAELLMQYLEAAKDGQGTATINGKSVSKKDILSLGVSDNTLTNLQSSTKELEALRDAIDKLKNQLENKSPFIAFESNFSKALDKIQKGFEGINTKLMGEGIDEMGGSIQKIIPEIKEFGNSMGQIFGEQTGDDINTVVELLGNTAQVGQGVGKIMAGDVVGGIKDAVTGIGNIFAMGSEASQRHKEALKIINESVKAQEHAYQLALKLKSLEYEKGDTIFGDDPYGKAINAAREYKDAIEDLKESIKGDGKIKKSGLFALLNRTPETSDYAELENIKIVTGHKKTGLFGWGKGKDTYSGLLKVYPDLIDNQGQFNTELAKTILSERKMSDESKATLQRIIDNADAIEEAYSVMKDYLTDIFGDLGDNMTDALVNAFQKGEDAAEAFYDSASGMIQNLVKDMINSAVIAPVIQKATEDAMKVMEDTSLTNEQRMDKLMDIVDNALEQGLAASDTAKDLYDYANKAWKDKTGEDLYKPEDSSQSTTKGGFETMTQDQAGEMNGRLTGIMETNLRSEGYLKTISEWNQPIGNKIDMSSIAMPLNLINESSSRIEQMIEENKSIAINSYYELKDINKNTKELYQMNERLGNIEKNTKGLAPK